MGSNVQRGVSRKFPTSSPTVAKGVKSLAVTCGTRPALKWHGGSAWHLVNMSLGWDGSYSLFCGFEIQPCAFEKQTGCLAAGPSSALLETELLSNPS